MNDTAKGAIAVTGILAVATLSTAILAHGKSPITPSNKYTISLSASQSSIIAGESVAFTIFLEQISPTQNPLPGIDVEIRDVNGTTIMSGSTNSKGIFSATHAFETAGDYEYEAIGTSDLFKASGCSSCNGTISSGFITISVSAETSLLYSLILTSSTLSASAGNSITFSANLESIKPIKRELSGATITFIEDTTKTEGSAVTDSSGIAKIAIKFPEAGSYKLYAQYAPNSLPATISNVVDVIITPAASITSPPASQPAKNFEISLTANTNNITVGQSVLFTVTMEENSPSIIPLPGISIVLYSNDIPVAMGKTGSTGKYTTTVAFHTTGTYTLHAVASSSLFGTISSEDIAITVTGTGAPKTISPPRIE